MALPSNIPTDEERTEYGEKGEILFAVTDTGTGVPEDMHEQIFERFAKADAFVQGTGLGLKFQSLQRTDHLKMS